MKPPASGKASAFAPSVPEIVEDNPERERHGTTAGLIGRILLLGDK